MRSLSRAVRTQAITLLAFIALALLAPVGCGALPDASPLVDSAWSIHAAIDSAGGAVESELRRHPEGGEWADRFAQEWAVRTDATQALGEYAASIQSVVDAAGETRQRIGAVADSVTGLANAAGVVMPPAGVVAVATDAARFVLEQVNRIRAANSLEEAMGPAQVAVDFICGRIADDLRTTDEIILLVGADLESRVQARHQVEIEYRDKLFIARNKAYAGAPQDVMLIEMGALYRIEELLALTNSWHEPLQTELASIQERTDAVRDVIAAAAGAVEAWPAAHAQLRAAIASGRTLHIAAAMSAVVEVRDLVQRMRDL